MEENRHYHSERQCFDEVRIRTIPRWKDSELSGCEWRFCAFVEFLYKGVVVWEQSFRDCETAVQLMYGWFIRDAESKGIHSDPRKIRELLCDQEGCKEIATTKAYIKQHYCVGGGNCGSKIDAPFRVKNYLQFCDRHSTRGDQDFQDNDDNYEKVKIKES